MEINDKKTIIDYCDNITYLGHKFKRDRTGLLNCYSGKSSDNIYRFWNSSPIPKDNDRTLNILKSGILKQKDYAGLFESDELSVSIPLKSIDTINVFSNVIFDANVMNIAFKNDVCINIFNHQTGDYIGTFTPAVALRSEKLLFSQIETYNNKKKRLALAKDFVLAANHNMRLNLRYYSKHSENSEYLNAIDRIYDLDKQIKVCTSYEQVLLFEAQSKSAYYSCFDSIVSKSDFVFNTRTRRPPKNEINAMISFGNTLLYSLIATEINKTPLDIRVGFCIAQIKEKIPLISTYPNLSNRLL